MTTIRTRRDTQQNWNSVNPIPDSGEQCYETDTGRMKVGDGVTHYNNLPYMDNLHPTNVNNKDIDSKGGVFNGDFSIGEGSRISAGWIGDKSYGWYAQRTNAAIFNIGYEIKNGSKSMRISSYNTAADGGYRGGYFSSTELPQSFFDPSLDELKKNGIKLSQNKKYILSSNILYSHEITGAIRTQVALRCYDADGNYLGGISNNGVESLNKWEHLESAYVTPPNSAYGCITGKLIAQYDSVERTAWFKDIKLEEVTTATVGTEIPAPAGVQISGSTTTDNVDQSHLEGDEWVGATDIGRSQGQTFIPNEENHTALVAYCIFSGDPGTEFRVRLFKWDTDYATTIRGQIISDTGVLAPESGYVRFDLPCKLVPGEKYLYHATGNGVNLNNCVKIRGLETGTYPNGEAYSYENGIVIESGDWNFKTLFAKHTKSPVVSANGAALDLDDVELLTGATITINPDGTGHYEYYKYPGGSAEDNYAFRNDLHSVDPGYIITNFPAIAFRYDFMNNMVTKHEFVYPAKKVDIDIKVQVSDETRTWNLEYSSDGEAWLPIAMNTNEVHMSATITFTGTTFYTRISHADGSTKYLITYNVSADLDCTSVQLPLLIPSDEIQSEAHDLTIEQMDISDGEYLPLENDLRGWSNHNIVMLTSEEEWIAQVVSAETLYVYDSNDTTTWTWDSRNGIVPPADRITGKVLVKYMVGPNQVLTSTNDGSMEAGFKLFWEEGDIRKEVETINKKINKKVNANFIKKEDLGELVPEIVSPPSTSTSPGKEGQIAYDENYLYVCVSENIWIRAPFSSW